MKLRTKIQLFSIVFMIVIVGIINTSIYLLFYKLSSEEEINRLNEQTTSIVEALNASGDEVESDILRAFLPSNSIIRVIDKDGEELTPVLTKKPEYVDIPLKFYQGESKFIINDDALGRIAVISKPIAWTDGGIVTLQVSQQLISFEETMQTLQYVLIAATLFSLIPTFFAGSMLTRFIIRPITLLIHTMKRNIKQDDWDKIELDQRSEDEIFEMKATFNEMIDTLKETFEKQESFVSDASHELKTPIAIIKGYAQLLDRRGKSHPEIFEESVDAIDSESDRMLQLVDQLLLLAKNKEAVSFGEVNIGNLCEKVIKPFHTTWKRDIVFDNRAEGYHVYGNIDQLEQVLYILISNALKYSDDAIKVIISQENDNLKLQVIDRGTGIEKDDQARIFDRFYRIDKARTRSTGGTGLGLAIAKQISEMHGGTIKVESIVEIGSTFIVILPIMKKES